MFQERNRNLQHPNKDGEYFFDRNSKAFHYVMEFYRTGQILWDTRTVVGTRQGTNVTKRELEEELEYFQIKPKDTRVDAALTTASSVLDKFVQAIETLILKHVAQLGKIIIIDANKEMVRVIRVETEPMIDPTILREFNVTAYNMLKEIEKEIAQHIISTFPELNICWRSERSLPKSSEFKIQLTELDFNFTQIPISVKFR